MAHKVEVDQLKLRECILRVDKKRLFTDLYISSRH